MFMITKEHSFSYSHILEGLPEGHQCARLHGHNAVVKLALEADHLNDYGFVVDYGDLKPITRWLDEKFDHRHLNDVVDFQPTAENLARLVWTTWAGDFPQLASVGWSETPKTWAYYDPASS